MLIRENAARNAVVRQVLESGEQTLKKVIEEGGRDFEEWNKDWNDTKQQWLDEQEQRLLRREKKMQEAEDAKKMPSLMLTKEQEEAQKEAELQRIRQMPEKKTFEQQMAEKISNSTAENKIAELRREREKKLELEREEKERTMMLKQDRTIAVTKDDYAKRKEEERRAVIEREKMRLEELHLRDKEVLLYCRSPCCLSVCCQCCCILGSALANASAANPVLRH